MIICSRDPHNMGACFDSSGSGHYATYNTLEAYMEGSMMTLSPEEKRMAIKRSTELLRQGATMLGLQCPRCGSPLFRLRSGEVVCPIHGRVVIARSESDVVSASVEASLERLQRVRLRHPDQLTEELAREGPLNPDLVEQTSRVLELLERTSSLRSTRRETSAPGQGRGGAQEG